MPGFKNGIDIQAPLGAPIRAVKGGTTLFAGWFKGYGNMVILDHGDNYCTVYTHAQELFKTKGDAVKPGEVIGTVGDTCSLDGPKLHFEIRHHGKPVDPLKWIEKRSQN
jgi:septal ring factor EnvC (AmiA/AmiB activator)